MGPGAASNIGDCRWSESENIKEWLEASAEPEIQALSPQEAMAEIPLLALRTRGGLDWGSLSREAATKGLSYVVSKWETALAPFVDGGFLAQEGDTLRLTAKGMLLSNQIFQVFVD
jgi:coproporphyrinogen III oxidase-like Fe-S oxidoreductase